MAQQQVPIPFPAAGYIKGGVLKTWRFHFLRFIAQPRGLVLMARCTPLHWPFPIDVRMTHVHFETLESFAKARDRELDARKEITAAYAVSRLHSPDELFVEPLTLRAIVQRSYQMTARPIQ